MEPASQEAFFDEQRAYEFIEKRVWPCGPVCPRCHNADRVGKLNGNTTRIGVYKCYRCRKPFTVKIGTVLESSHVPLNAWLQAIYLLCLGKREISVTRLSHVLGTSVRTAALIRERIRQAENGHAGFGGGIGHAPAGYAVGSLDPFVSGIRSPSATTAIAEAPSSIHADARTAVGTPGRGIMR